MKPAERVCLEHGVEPWWVTGGIFVELWGSLQVATTCKYHLSDLNFTANRTAQVVNDCQNVLFGFHHIISNAIPSTEFLFDPEGLLEPRTAVFIRICSTRSILAKLESMHSPFTANRHIHLITTGSFACHAHGEERFSCPAFLVVLRPLQKTIARLGTM